MSLADDQDFCNAVVEQSARIIAEHVGKVQLQLNAEKQKRQKLEARVESLESTVQELLNRGPNPCDCQQTMLNAFGAAMTTISSSHVTNEPPLREVFEPMFLASSTPVVSKTTHPAKRPRVAETSLIIDSLDDLPEDLMSVLQPFFKKDNQACQDKCNNVQRAFIKYKANQICTTGESTSNAALIKTIIKEGADHRLWTSEFNPMGENGSFEKYLTNRLKNEKKALKRREVMDTQASIVRDCLEKSLRDELSFE